MTANEFPEGRGSLQKAILWATVVSGFVAAYLMYRRGESLGSIAKQTITNPVGSLVSEVKFRSRVAERHGESQVKSHSVVLDPK